MVDPTPNTSLAADAADEALDALLRTALQARAEPVVPNDLARRVMATAVRPARPRQAWTTWAAAAAIGLIVWTGASRYAALPSGASSSDPTTAVNAATSSTSSVTSGIENALLPIGGTALVVTMMGLAVQAALALPEQERTGWVAGV